MNLDVFRAILCGLAMLGLAGASLVLESRVNVPLAGEYGFMCLTAPHRLIWWDRQRASGLKADQSVYDLETGKLVMRNFRQCPWRSCLMSDGRYVRLEARGSSAMLCVMDCETLETIREVKIPVLFKQELLDKRYLVTDRAGTMYVCDVLADDPSKLRTLSLTGWHPQALTQLYLVGGTNLVVEVSASLNTAQASSPSPPNAVAQTSNVHVYQINEKSIRLVASWESGVLGSGISRQGDTLLSLSPDGLTLEGRDLSKFELVRRETLPQAIVDCLPWVNLTCDLCEVTDPSSRQHTFYRLDTLKALDNVRGLSFVDRGILALDRSNSPYRLLFSQDSSDQFRIAVYDMDRDKLVWDQTYDGYTAELLDGDRLAVAHSEYGITAEIIDLKTSQLLKKMRPYAWLLPVYVLWAIATVSAAFGWIYYSARAGLKLLTSILMLGAAIVPIPVYALIQHGTAMNIGRLATSYSLAILLSATAGVVWLAFSRLQNRILCFTCQLVTVSTLAIAFATLALNEAFPQQWILAGALIVACFCAFASFIGLLVLRFLGYRSRWANDDQNAQSNPALAQFFTLTAATAGILVATAPFRIIPWHLPKNVGHVVAFAVPIVIPYLFVFVLLKVSERTFRRWTIIAATVSALLVLDFIGAFVRPHPFTFSIVLANVRICLASFVITFLWLWAFRLRGCSIARRTSLRSV